MDLINIGNVVNIDKIITLFIFDRKDLVSEDHSLYRKWYLNAIQDVSILN